ncbi:MAG TPA: alpha/beta hydrolase [Anaeromyxobacteraceae bacterium]|nr:alpha/beta hydrolase [Anaeromyxobacteraceae bacterium]
MAGRQGQARASDGTRLWWHASGAGSPAVALTDGIACAGFIWKHLEPALARSWRVIRWNYRGHGRSDPPRDASRVEVEDHARDLLAVLDAAGERRAVLAGHSMGVQVVLEAHRQAPQRVAGLLLVCGSPGHLLDTFHDSSLLSHAFPYLRALVEAFPEAARWVFRRLVPTELAYQLGSRLETNHRLVRREDLFPYLDEVSAMDPTLFVRMLEAASRHDAEPHLPEVDVPALVVAGEADTWTPYWLSQRMAAAIRGAELLVLRGGSHVGPLEHPELLALRVESFLRRRVSAGPERPRRPRSRPRRTRRRA